MDILNDLPPERFREVDDLLAFVSIYDDRRRTEAYFRLLEEHRAQIEGHVCLEAGCGFGIFSAKMAEMGARHVYAVEQNPLLASIARRRLACYRNVSVVELPLQEFQPPEPIEVLVHDFFGQLLYDEDLWVLDNLRFRPRLVLPEAAELAFGVVNSADYVDETVSSEVLQHLAGVLVSGLFEERGNELRDVAAEWSYATGLRTQPVRVDSESGDLIAFGLRIVHNGKVICQAGDCPNWSYVWTPRVGSVFLLRFVPEPFGSKCIFEWVE